MGEWSVIHIATVIYIWMMSIVARILLLGSRGKDVLGEKVRSRYRLIAVMM
jgi:hypothetical protein